ncbi:MAG: hypothetical protein K8I00_07650, partial [Candidatus Omnitrophica bacterium]|nr:hypothetical protein [Candidatus Omnitrophota bacterium]
MMRQNTQFASAVEIAALPAQAGTYEFALDEAGEAALKSMGLSSFVKKERQTVAGIDRVRLPRRVVNELIVTEVAAQRLAQLADVMENDERHNGRAAELGGRFVAEAGDDVATEVVRQNSRLHNNLTSADNGVFVDVMLNDLEFAYRSGRALSGGQIKALSEAVQKSAAGQNNAPSLNITADSQFDELTATQGAAIRFLPRLTPVMIQSIASSAEESADMKIEVEQIKMRLQGQTEVSLEELSKIAPKLVDTIVSGGEATSAAGNMALNITQAVSEKAKSRTAMQILPRLEETDLTTAVKSLGKEKIETFARRLGVATLPENADVETLTRQVVQKLAPQLKAV